METSIPPLNPALLQEIYLLKRPNAAGKVAAVFDGESGELCIRTRFPKQVAGFVSACLAQRGELETGAGRRTWFLRDRAAWQQLCDDAAMTKQVLVADPELGYEFGRSELLAQARVRGHAVIFSSANPRSDIAEVVTLLEPNEYDVRELLKKHGFTPPEAERLAKRSNGNIYLLTRLLTGTSDRPLWSNDKDGYHLRCLALIGGWNDESDGDRAALTKILGEPYAAWVEQVYPLTKKEEPPVLLDGKVFHPISRYELWQQLSGYLRDADLNRLVEAAVMVLGENAPELELPKEERELAGFRGHKPAHSSILRQSLAETLALLGGQGKSLSCSPNLAGDVARQVVWQLLGKADWKRWASLSLVMTQLAEAAPNTFLEAVEEALVDVDNGPLKELFAAYEGSVFGRNYHCGLLWALEILAWHGDYLNRVSVALAKMSRYPLPRNAGNNPGATLRSIFLPWLPQTLASVEARRAAVELVMAEEPEVGWKLLLGILPDSHQIGSYHQKPAWRDWFPADWTEGVTRAEHYRQVRNYAELAVQVGMADVVKLTELISRWDNLPPEVFAKVLEYLESPEAQARTEDERFAIWQKLSAEIDRHRKYAKADWAMPEEEVLRLENAAKAIMPDNPSVLHRRLFNGHDHEFFQSDNYEEETIRIAQLREAAVADILKREGIDELIAMARTVNAPLELGQALGRQGTADLDRRLLPALLNEGDRPAHDLVRGYIWARHYKTEGQFAPSVATDQWTPEQHGLFFSNQPFVAAVWRLAEKRLGGQREEYWKRIMPNPYQARDDLREAVEQSLANGRPDIAMLCVNALRHLKQDIPAALIADAVKKFLTSAKVAGFDHHELVELIQYLQQAPDADADAVTWIEFQCLRLLDRFSGASPVFLERKLANEPAFFHDLLKVCFRSENEPEGTTKPDDQKKALAEQSYGLLHHWQTPPGTTREGQMDEAAFSKWLAEVEKLCRESGHWSIGQQRIGHALVYAPAGLEAMFKLPVVAKALDTPAHDHIRRGFQVELFNLRGVHGFTHGRDELELGKKYRAIAERYDLAKYPRIAGTLRGLAESYERDAEREAKRDPLGD